MKSQVFWEAPPPDIGLSDHEVHVWRVRLDQVPARVQAAARLLAPNERQRAARFRFERDRRRYIVSQASLRQVLARYLERPPEQIVFRRSERGKPALASADTLRFNASHSHELALYAVTHSREVGIDIEHLHPLPDAAQIVRRFFAEQERATFFRLPEAQRQAAFFTCWTRKEALLKARGEGLYRPLHQFAVSFGPDDPPRLLYFEDLPQEPQRWTFRALTPAPGYVATLVVEWPLRSLRTWHFNVNAEAPNCST
jgi:4'-phosphopantetheinyl transferase